MNDALTFKDLQIEASRQISKGNYERAVVALNIAMDKVMYKNAEHSMHRLREAVNDIVWLYGDDHVSISDERVTDVLDFFEEECFGHDEKYKDSLIQLRMQAAKKLPEAAFRERQGLNLPEKRQYWKLPPVSAVMEESAVSGYEPDLMKAKHLTLTESFLYLYLNFSRVLKYLQAQSFLNTEMVYTELLPLIHPDLDMEKNGENETAKNFGVSICYLLEEGFEELAGLYQGSFDAEKAAYLKERCGLISESLGLLPETLLQTALLAPLLADEKDGESVYDCLAADAESLLTYINQQHEALSSAVGWEEIKRKQAEISWLCAEYCALYGVGEYRMAVGAQVDAERFLDAMELAAGNGITLAAEEMMRTYFYGQHGCEIHPGYAKFYSRLVSLRQIASSIGDAIEAVEDLEMMIPGTDI